IRTLSFELGQSTEDLRARIPLRIRVRKSAMGSVIDIANGPYLPARLDHAGNLTLERQAAETQTAHVELTHVRPGAPTERAAVALAHVELVLLREHLGQTTHAAAPCAVAEAWRKGIPRYWSNARPSASVLAVVTMVTLRPFTESMLS